MHPFLSESIGQFIFVKPVRRSAPVKATSDRFEIQAARNSAELRSIASLRASNFFDYANASCSALAAQSHLRVKADSIWEYLEESCCPTDEGAKDCLICFFAAASDAPGSSLAAAVKEHMDLSCTLPSEEDKPPRIVLGSLDLTIGPRLGGEQLAGRLPKAPAAQQGRAYISNVSVAPAARRQGIASALIAAAHRHASSIGVSHLYVHAAVDNSSAVSLYGSHCGFDVEQEEAPDLARSLNRPRRLLFHKTVLPLESLTWKT